jgi:hypothetical protein
VNRIPSVQSLSIRLLLGVLLALTVAGGAEGQAAKVKQPAMGPAAQVKRPVEVRALPKPVNLLLPDLKVSGFNVPQGSGILANGVVSFPFRVTVSNDGRGSVNKAYYLAFETYSETRTRWEGGRDSTNCIKIDRALQPNASFSYSGALKFSSGQISNHTIRVRAVVDSGCFQEFPPPDGSVKESDENNNFSNEVSVAGAYYPVVADLSPGMTAKGNGHLVRLSGTGFGRTADTHTVMISKGAAHYPAVIRSWHEGVIDFTVPGSVAPGTYEVSIADTNTSRALSARRQLKVVDTKLLSWASLIDTWNIFNDAFSVHLDTYGGKHKYENTSTISIVQSQSIDIPKIEFELAGLKYLALIKDLNTRTGHPAPIVLTRTGCRSNQFRLEASFESEGVEIVTYNKALGPGGIWCDDCVSDIHVNNGKLIVLFTLSARQGGLDYQAQSEFQADIKASNKVADKLMDAFLGNWNGSIRSQVRVSVDRALASSETKAFILNGLSTFIRMTAGLTGRTITDIQFANDGMHLTYL